MNYTSLISARILHPHLDNPAWVIVDCRFRLDNPQAGRAMYNELHIPGAVYADLDRDLSAPAATPDEGRHPLPDLQEFRAKLGNWGINQRVQVVCYDDWGGVLAARLWWMLRYLGHESVAVLDGGWQNWIAHDYPTSKALEHTSPTTFEGEPNPNMLADLSEVASLSAQGEGKRLIDAREAKRYRGEIEPIDAQAGHIPGARNYHFAKNLTTNATMQPANELRKRWQSFLGRESPSEMIMYCGSGVSACHNLLAMEHVGLRGARLFIPSWSGWSANPERPIEITE
jgi:thiosulfate/3-mercaptopyruvate sulfurtransferase